MAATKVQTASVPEIPSDTILRYIHRDGLVLFDLDGRITYTNERFCAMVGRSGEDLRGLRWPDLIDEAASARLDPVVTPALIDGRVNSNIEICAPGGVRGTYYVTASQVRDANDRPIGVLQNLRRMDRLRERILELEDVRKSIQPEKDRPNGAVTGMTGVVRDEGEIAQDEARRLRSALETCRWNTSKTARALGISRTILWRRMRRLGLLDAT